MWGPVSNALLHEVIAGQPTVTLCADYRSGTARDFSLLQRHGVPTDPVRFNPMVGASFAGAGRITHPDHVSGRNTTGSVVILGRIQSTGLAVNARLFSARDAGGRRIEIVHSTTSSTYLIDSAATVRNVAASVLGKECLAVDYTSGQTGNMYLDGVFVSAFSGASVIQADDAAIVIGALYSGADSTSRPVACVFETNRPLTATEHAQVYAEMASTKWLSKPSDRATLNDGRRVWCSSWGTPVSTANRGGVTGAELENTGWRFGSTTPRYTVTADQQIDGKVHKANKCVTAGYLYLPTATMGMTPAQAAYGEWVFSFSKQETSTMDIYPIASEKGLYTDAVFAGYMFRASGTEALVLYRCNGAGAAAALFFTGVSYVSAATWYSIRITRTAAGLFTMWIKGGTYTVWTLVGSATDNTHTTSNYMVIDNDAGDMVSLGSGSGDGLVHTSL